MKKFLPFLFLLFIVSCNNGTESKVDSDNRNNDDIDVVYEDDEDEYNDELRPDFDYLEQENDDESNNYDNPSDSWIVNSSILMGSSQKIYISGYVSSGIGETYFIKRLENGSWETIYEPGDYINGVLTGENGEIALVFADGGTEFLNNTTEETIKTAQCSEAVWGTSFSDIYSVISGGIYHFDGTNQKKIEVSTSNSFKALWGVSSDNIYAVGEKGAIIHYDGEKWAEMESGTTEELNSIWGSSHDDVYVAGGSENTGNHIILHFNGEKWENVVNGSGFILLGIDGMDKNNVFAVGAGRNGKNEVESAVLHYDGNSWNKIASDFGNFLWDVQVMPDGSAYVVGPDNTIERITP